MLSTYTLKEMKELWRHRLGLLVDDCGCAVTRHDGTSLDALITDRIRCWYAGLLITQSPELLPVREMSPEVISGRYLGDNCIEVQYPEKGVRPVSVLLDDWEQPLSRFHSPQSPEAMRQSSRRLAATPGHPLAVDEARILRLYGIRTSGILNRTALSRLMSLRMVAWPEKSDTFILSESLLSTIPTDI